MVEDVIEVGSKFKCPRFSEFEVLQEREISVPESRLGYHHPRRGPKARLADNLECIDVEVSTFSPVTTWQSLFCDQIRAIKARPRVGAAGAVTDLSGIAGLCLENEVRLPAAQDLA